MGAKNMMEGNICTYANELLELINGLSDFGEIGFPISPTLTGQKSILEPGKRRRGMMGWGN